MKIIIRNMFLVILVCMTYLTVRLFKFDYHVVADERNSTSTGMQACQERCNVAFLKVHKAGSSTVMNIFMRFGEKRSLTCAIPKVKGENYIGYGKTLSDNKVLKPPNGKSYNLLYNHVVYNRSAFRRVMPNDTVYVAIVREPLDLLESAIRYLQQRFAYIKQIPEDKLSNYLEDPRKYETPKHADSFTNNRIAYDFGLSPNLLHDQEAIQTHLLSVSEDFDVVLILEYFDESLILMKRKLCWTFADIIYTKSNVNKLRIKSVFTQEIRKTQKAWAVADNMFYDFFYEQFWKTVAEEKNDFFLEVKEFKFVLEYVQDFCSKFEDENSADSGSHLVVKKNDFSAEFTVTKEDCKLMTMPELTFMKIIHDRHLKTLKNVIN